MNVTDQKRPGAPRGNRNAIRHGAYATLELSCEDSAIIADIKSHFLDDFPNSDNTDIELFHDMTKAYLILLRALQTNCADAASRASRRFRKATKALKARGKQRNDAPKITPAEWATDLLERYRKWEERQKPNR